MKYEVLDIKSAFLSQNGHRIDFEIEKIIINIEHIRKGNPITYEEAFWFETEIELEGHITDIGLLDIWESVNPDPLKLTIYEGDTEISFGNLFIQNIRMPTFSNYISIRLYERKKITNKLSKLIRKSWKYKWSINKFLLELDKLKNLMKDEGGDK